jgi:hypothetical protein
LIIYVNGDSHSAGAEALNLHAFAEDDGLYYGLGRKPHPDNLAVSYGCNIANELFAVLHCDAESASSNARILRTTHEYLSNSPKPDLVIIGWSTWEREEWFHDGKDYQVTASGTDDVPDVLKEQYKQWVIQQSTPDIINNKLIKIHERIIDLHIKLEDLKIPHLFFNAFQSFSNIRNLKHMGAEPVDWNGCYIGPYDEDLTYYNWLKAQGFQTANEYSYHFRADAHRAWADFLLQNYIQTALTS